MKASLTDGERNAVAQTLSTLICPEEDRVHIFQPAPRQSMSAMGCATGASFYFYGDVKGFYEQSLCGSSWRCLQSRGRVRHWCFVKMENGLAPCRLYPLSRVFLRGDVSLKARLLGKLGEHGIGLWC